MFFQSSFDRTWLVLSEKKIKKKLVFVGRIKKKKNIYFEQLHVRKDRPVVSLEHSLRNRCSSRAIDVILCRTWWEDVVKRVGIRARVADVLDNSVAV